MKPIKVIISGGGTGGHLFPAIAIAQAVKAAYTDVEILFVGAKGKIEEKKVPEAGYEIELLEITGFARKLTFKNVTFFFKLIKSLRKSKKILKKFKPDIAIGVGGYASGPLVYKASKMGTPVLLQEQNSYPGITNKLLSKRASKICVAYDNLDRFFPTEKIIKTGNPVRENLLISQPSRKEAAEFFGLDPNKKIILSVGGSGGARTINHSIAKNLKSITDADVQIIWQTGGFYFEESDKVAKEHGSANIKATAFISRMDLAFAAADVVISRAGAGTISELCLLEKACIMVPSPNVAEDHQTKNAMALTETGAAILVKDKDAEKELIKTAIELIKNEDECKKLKENIAKHGVKDSAAKIAQEVLKLVGDIKISH